MNDAIELTAVIVLIYVGECATLLHEPQLALRALVRRPRETVGIRVNATRRLVWTQPLPALGSLFVFDAATAQPAGEGNAVHFDSILDRAHAVRLAVRPLRIGGTLQFALLLVLLPALVAAHRLQGVALPFFGAVLVLHLLLVLGYRAVVRALHAGTNVTTHTWKLAISPLTAIRAADLAQRPGLREFDPLAVAFLLCAPEEFLRQARARLQPAAGDVTAPAAAATGEDGAAAPAPRLERVLRAAGLRPENLALSPAAGGIDERTWCPRCRRRFALEHGTCPDCDGVALRRLAPRQHEDAQSVLRRIGERQARALRRGA
jgi:hypothetical protein